MFKSFRTALRSESCEFTRVGVHAPVRHPEMLERHLSGPLGRRQHYAPPAKGMGSVVHHQGTLSRGLVVFYSAHTLTRTATASFSDVFYFFDVRLQYSKDAAIAHLHHQLSGQLFKKRFTGRNPRHISLERGGIRSSQELRHQWDAGSIIDLYPIHICIIQLDRGGRSTIPSSRR
jgi:hypothetical protein